MDYQALNFWLHAAEMAMITLIGVYQFFVNRSRVTATSLDSLRAHIDKSIEKVEADMQLKHDSNVARIGDVEGDMRRIDGELKHAPNHDDLKRIHARMDDIGADVATIKGGMRTLDVIHDYLLNGGKR